MGIIMITEFNLVKYLTSDRDKGRIVWLFNIGAEKYWNEANSGVVDRSENAVVNRIEEMNLLISRKQDYVILRRMPDKYYLNMLEEMGFSIPAILTPKDADELTPISELVLRDEALLRELKSIQAQNENVFLVPYGVTYIEEEIARKTGLKLIGAPSEICSRVNNKISNRLISERLDLPLCKGEVCSSADEIRAAYYKLTNQTPFFEKVIIKEPTGASGKGLYIIDCKERLESVLRLITRMSRGKTGCKWLVEGWYKKKEDLNCQVYISPKGSVDVFSIKQQLLRDTVYFGSKISPDLDDELINTYAKYGMMIGKYLFNAGYTGVAGIDSIVSSDNVLIPIIEINGRFTLSTYISFLNSIFKNKKILSRYFRMITDSPMKYEKICSELKDNGILYTGENGVFVYTSGTLPGALQQENGSLFGRAFTLIIADDWDKVEEINARLETVMQGLTK